MLLRFAASLLLIGQPASAAAQAIDENSTSWNCELFFKLGSGLTALSGSYRHLSDFHGNKSRGIYDFWGGVRVEWAVAGLFAAPQRRINYITVDAPMVRHPAGIYGYIFGDGDLISSSTLLSATDYQRGYSTFSTASFRGGKIEEELDKHDRWTFVVQNGDGHEIIRRTLEIPNRQLRDQAFYMHTAAQEAAWKDRDTKLLETVDVNTLPADKAHCLLSTPQTRQFIEASTYDPMPTIRR